MPLAALRLKDIDNIVGADDPRNADWIDALRQRLQAFNGDGSKAFASNQPPLFKPSNAEKTAPQIRSVKLLATQKSGLPVRNGMANNGSMLRVDIFTKGGKFFPVPIYVADAAQETLPNHAVVAYKPESEWPEMDEGYAFLFSLYPNDWISIKLKTETIAGYFSGLDRATGAVSVWAHDRNQAAGKDGQWRGVGVKTALAIEKYHADILGNLHRVRVETRQPIYRPKGKKA